MRALILIILVALIILWVVASAGCTFVPDADALGGYVVKSKCGVCRLVWTAAGYRVVCEIDPGAVLTPTSQPDNAEVPDAADAQ